MSQSWTDDVFAAGHVAQTDLQNIEYNFACLKSSFSGIAAPSTSTPGQFWFETDNGTYAKGILKFRNGDNDDWLAVMPCDNGNEGSGAKGYIWLYRNNSVDGMIIDTTVTDRVLAIKGGSVSYNVSGGTLAGTSFTTLRSHIHSHSHSGGGHTHDLVNVQVDSGDPAGQTVTSMFSTGDSNLIVSGAYIRFFTATSTGYSQPRYHLGKTTGSVSTSLSTDSTASNLSDARPAAAVGTLQRPDL